MNTRPENSKLVELRSKTDRQLVELMTRMLEAGWAFARMEEFHSQADRVCEDVRRLLPCLSRTDRRRFEARLQELTDRLHPAAQAACF